MYKTIITQANSSIRGTTRARALWLPALLFAFCAGGLAQQVEITQYTVPNSASATGADIAAGPDGALWFTDSGTNAIGRITVAGIITEYPLPTAGSNPDGITVGPDGALWFTEFEGNRIGRVTTAGVIAEYSVPTDSQPSGITTGPDGALWFTESAAGKIGRITTAGVVTEYRAPTFDPVRITTGPDGALWFTEEQGNQIGRITTAGVTTGYPVPTVNSFPLGITAGPDGALWFTEEVGNKIGRITTTGVITEYPVPIGNSQVAGITVGPDGALWFCEFFGRVGRITTAGKINEYGLPHPGNPFGITAGPHGSLWFTQAHYVEKYDDIGEIVFVNAGLTVSPASGHFGTPLSFTGSTFAPGETVDIYIEGLGSGVDASATTDASGSFTATGLETLLPYGPHLFMGLGQTSGKIGAATLSVEPGLSLKPNSGMAGAIVTVGGAGFGPFELVSIFWNNTGLFVGYTTADVHGSFGGSTGVTMTVPSGASSGANLVFGHGSSTGAVGKGNFTVQ